MILSLFTNKRYLAFTAASLMSTQLYSEEQVLPKVISSIKPIHLIVADITQGVAKSQTLLPPGASPHQYSLRPSEIKTIHNSKAIFWVGPELEQFLVKPFAKYPDKSVAILPLLEQHEEDEQAHTDSSSHAESDSVANHDEEEASHEEDDTGHHHGEEDPHIWLDPIEAIEIAELVAKTTIEKFPQQSAQLEKNLAAFKQEITLLDSEIMQQLAPLHDKGFLVFHDAYSRFVTHYGLNQVAALTLNPAKRPGAKHLSEIKEIMTTQKPVCIFSEPQFKGVAIDTLVRNIDIKVAELDPLAIEVKAEDKRYASFLKHFSQQISQCLSAK